MFAPYASTCGWADQWAPEPVEIVSPARVRITPGTSTRYRVWLDGECVAQVDDADMAIEIRRAIKRHLAAERVAAVNAETDRIMGRAA